MDISGFLQTVAQVSVALAGFAALISAFLRQNHEWAPDEIAGRNIILELTLATAFFALIPFAIEAVLVELGLLGVWRISSALLLAFLILWGLYNLRRSARHGIGKRMTNSAKIEWVYNLLLLGINGFLALNIVLWGTAAIYMIGLIWMLLAAGTQFMLFVYLYSRQND